MAIARVQSKTANSGASSVATLNIVLDAAPTDGNIIVLAASGVSAVNGCSIAQTAGITWTWIADLTPSGSVTTILAIGRVFASASATITLNFGTAGGISIVAAEYSGASTNCDRTAWAQASTTTPASGATATTANANELWVGAIGVRTTVTFSSPTNSFAIVDQSATSLSTVSDRSVCLLEKIVSATATANAGATISGVQIWGARVLTIEAAASGGGLLRTPPMTGGTV